MPRSARFTFNNAIYHILSRGNNRQVVFLQEADYEKFLDLLSLYKNKNNLQIYHYVLMTNHYHMILSAADGKVLADTMKGLNLSYAKHYRRKYGGVGYLWQGRFKSFVIQDGRYLLECGRYIELNPVRAGISEKAENYPWTSCRVYEDGEKNSIVDINPEYLGMGRNTEERQKTYREFLISGITERRSLNRYFRVKAYGSKEFIENLKNDKNLKQIWSHSGRPKKKK